jgi:hypothetical protein
MGRVYSMGTTADKLTYLNNTKGLLKDRLNSLGATITSSTTFKNYLTWLDTFYNNVSNKTDLATNGIKGRLSQGSSPTPSNPQTISYLTGNVNYEITTQDGTDTFTIPLGDIKLCDVNLNKDLIYESDGKFYLLKKTGYVNLDGTTKTLSYYGLYGNDNAPLFYIDVSDIIIPANYNSRIIYSKHYTQYFVAGSGAKAMPNNNIRGATSSHKIYIRDDRYTSANDINNWLSSNNDDIVYLLATPTTTEITSSNYPELYAALKEIQDYLTSYKINKEFILGYSSPNIEY